MVELISADMLTCPLLHGLKYSYVLQPSVIQHYIYYTYVMCELSCRDSRPKAYSLFFIRQFTHISTSRIKVINYSSQQNYLHGSYSSLLGSYLAEHSILCIQWFPVDVYYEQEENYPGLPESLIYILKNSKRMRYFIKFAKMRQNAICVK